MKSQIKLFSSLLFVLFAVKDSSISDVVSNSENKIFVHINWFAFLLLLGNSLIEYEMFIFHKLSRRLSPRQVVG